MPPNIQKRKTKHLTASANDAFAAIRITAKDSTDECYAEILDYLCAVLEQEEKREQAEAAAVAAAPADGGEVSTTGDRISAGAAMNPAVRTAETAPLLGPESMELIQVLLYGEIFRRRQKKGFRKF